MTHTAHSRRPRPGAALELPRLTGDLEYRELEQSLEESGEELRMARAQLRTARTEAAREREQLLAVLARTVAGVMDAADDALGEALDVLEANGFVPVLGEMGVAA